MKRTRRAWVVYGVCAVAVAAALGWITRASLRLERQVHAAQAQARYQESLRLALWRMDSAVSSLLAQEASRPYFHYQRRFAPERVYTNVGEPRLGDNVIAMSPLAESMPEFVRLYFEMDASGNLTSPEVAPAPTKGGKGSTPDAGVTGSATSGPAADMRARFEALRELVDRDRLAAAIQDGAGAAEPMVITRGGAAPRDVTQRGFQTVARPRAMQQAGQLQQIPQPAPQQADAQAQQSQQEFNIRQQRVQIARNDMALSNPDFPSSGEVVQGPLVPVWLAGGADAGPQLLFAREVRVGGAARLQGFWVDWPALRDWLVRDVGDLLVGASLEPVARARSDAQQSLSIWTPTRVTLIVAWVAVLGAMATGGLVLRTALDLSERRGQFVSAVTHELRTPLTTFRMYSEMLAEGMVADEGRRREYLTTLTGEAERLTRTVENVLTYARVEQNRAATHRERVALGSLLGRVRARLVARADADGRTIVLEGPADAAGPVLDVDVQAVDQILFNLVDNSCKYANAAEDKRLHLVAAARDGRVELRYWDHGPGIPAGEEKHLFTPFRRVTHDGTESTPGIGLGLALARGLARELGGDLRLDRRRDEAGAAFILILPTA
jgi:signal transduction histidine kinase